LPYVQHYTVAMRILFVLTLFVFCIILPGLSQSLAQVDSLKTLSATQSLSEQMKSYDEIADLLLDSKPDESLFYSRKSLAIALETENHLGLMRAYNNLGWYYLQISESDSTIFYLSKAINLGKKTGDNHSLLNSMTALSSALSKQMKYDSAILILNEALEIAGNMKSAPHLANIYAVLGNTFSSCDQADTAIALYFKAKEYYQESGNQRDLAVMLNNIASLMIHAQKHDYALELLNKAIDINTEINHVVGKMQNINNDAICYKELGLFEKAVNSLNLNIALTRSNNFTTDLAKSYTTMANTLSKMEHYQRARLYFDSSLFICNEMGIDYGIMINAIDLGNMYKNSGQCDSALVNFKKSLKLIEPYNLKYEKSKILSGMYDCYKNLEVFDSALLYLEQYKTMSDSLNKVDVTNTLTELEGKYQQEKNLAKIASLNENIYYEKSKHRLNIIIISSIFFLILLYTLVRRYQSRNKILQARIIEKEKKSLEIELQSKQKELAVKAMHMAHLNEQSLELSLKLKDVSQHVSGNNKEKIIDLINNLDKATPKNAWKEFETRFENVHQDFYRVLTELHPELTPTEIKICSLIRLNMTTKDIAVLTNRSIRTIEGNRTHIRKKLDLSPETSLTGYLLSI